MKKKISLIRLSRFGLLLSGCKTNTDSASAVLSATPSVAPSETPSNSTKPSVNETISSASVEVRPNYYLTGNINLGNDKQKKFEYDQANDTYSLEGISLKRGDSFAIDCSKEDKSIGFDNLSSASGFEKGNGNFINVQNEGIYTLSIQNGVLNRTKTDSNYKEVKLVYADGKESLAFEKQSDFTFALKDASLRYQQKFSILLDGETLDYDDLAINDTYYAAFRAADNSIESVKKGSFDLTIDFSKEKPVIITSDDRKKPNYIPKNVSEYEELSAKLSKAFAQNGTSYTAYSQEKDVSTGKITAYDATETIDTNQHYLKKEAYTFDADETKEGAVTKDKAKQNASVKEEEAIDTGSNFYVISDKDGKGSVNKTSSAIIRDDAPETDPDADIDEKFKRKYITSAEAKAKVIDFAGEANHVESIFDYRLSSAHISGNSAFSEKEIRNNLKIDGSYVSDLGDTIDLKFSNIEFNSGYNQTYVRNTFDVTIDEDGNPTKGTYTCKKYEGRDFISSDKKPNPEKNLDDYLTKETTYTFTRAFGSRQNVTDYKLDPAKYLTSDLDPTPDLTISCKVFDFGVDECGFIVDPVSACDLSNFFVRSFDSDYFKRNAGDGKLTGNGKTGKTKVTIANSYNLVEKVVDVTLDYEPYKSASQLGDFYIIDGSKKTSISSSALYTGVTYDLEIQPSVGYDPRMEITSNSDAVTITNLSTDEERKNNGKAAFKLTVNRLPKDGESVKLIATSKANSSFKKEVSLTIREPWTRKAAAGHYSLTSSYVSNYAYNIILNEDGTGSFTYKDNQYNFTFDVSSDGKITLKTSDNVTEFNATLSKQAINNKYTGENYTLNAFKADSIKVKVSDKTNSVASYSSYYQTSPLFNTSYKITDETGKTYTYSNFELETGYCYSGTIYFTDGTTTSKFKFKGCDPSNSYYNSSSVSVTSYYADASSSSYTTYSGSVSCSGTTYTITFGSKVFTFAL